MNVGNDHDYLSVSVIVPVYNDADRMGPLLEALLAQNYPREKLEIVVVDNNSSDQTREVVSQYPVMLVEEKEFQSSYAARNKGISHAKNEVLAFTDSDCVPDAQWIRRGIEAMKNSGAEMAGGEVEFFFSKKKTIAECYDAVKNFEVERSIRMFQMTMTANLLVRRDVFDKVGLFPHTIQSGGDNIWTKKATLHGFKLVYAQDAVVRHPARQLKELLKKSFRVGTGMRDVWRMQKVSGAKQWLISAALFLPPPPHWVNRFYQERATEDMKGKFLQIWWISYLNNFYTGLGILSALFTPKNS